MHNMTLAFKMQRLSQICNATVDMFMAVLKNRLLTDISSFIYLLIHPSPQIRMSEDSNCINCTLFFFARLKKGVA